MACASGPKATSKRSSIQGSFTVMGDVWNFSVSGPFGPWRVVMSLACLVR